MPDDLPPTFDLLMDLDPSLVTAYRKLRHAAYRHEALDLVMRELVLVAVNASTTQLHEDGTRYHMRAALAAGASPEEVLEVLELVSVLGIHAVSVGVPILCEELRARHIGMPVTDPEECEAVRGRYVSDRGGWPQELDDLLHLDSAFVDAYREFSTVASRRGRLSPALRELIFIAVDASTTHLHREGIRSHVKSALDVGATAEQILQVFELCATQGMHAAVLGARVLRTECVSGEVPLNFARLDSL